MSQYYDYDPGDRIEITTLRTRMSRTRGPRRLDCGHEVPKGTLYRRWVGIVDGEFTSVDQECLLCDAIAIGEPEDVERLRKELKEEYEAQCLAQSGT